MPSQQTQEPAEGSVEIIREVWLDLGRPGVALLQRELRARGYKFANQAVSDFVSRQESHQVFKGGLKHDGKFVSTAMNSRWSADLLDFAQSKAKENKGYRYALG